VIFDSLFYAAKIQKTMHNTKEKLIFLDEVVIARCQYGWQGPIVFDDEDVDW
jgi:hypothetical protein